MLKMLQAGGISESESKKKRKLKLNITTDGIDVIDGG